MSQLVEWVAQAIRAELVAVEGIDNDLLYATAIAAIESMRLTQPMLNAAIKFADVGGDIALHDMEAVFLAMIDADLKMIVPV